MARTMKVGDKVDLNFYGVKNWDKNKYSYQWITSDESIAVVDKNGNVTMLSEGIAIIRLELTEKATGKKLAVAPVEVGVPETEYDVFVGTSKEEASTRRVIAKGEAVDLNFYGVKAWKKEEYSYNWTSSDETIAIVDKKGMVTGLSAGKAVIRLEMVRKSTGEKLVIAPVVITIPE